MSGKKKRRYKNKEKRPEVEVKFRGDLLALVPFSYSPSYFRSSILHVRVAICVLIEWPWNLFSVSCPRVQKQLVSSSSAHPERRKFAKLSCPALSSRLDWFDGSQIHAHNDACWSCSGSAWLLFFFLSLSPSLSSFRWMSFGEICPESPDPFQSYSSLYRAVVHSSRRNLSSRLSHEIFALVF
jgi:hypothetical protein